MSTQDGARPSETGSHPAGQAPAGLDAPRFDPAREGVCEICNANYPPWSAASPLWNKVVRGGSINGSESHAFLCANCFIELAHGRQIASGFRLSAEHSVNLETVTPSGRVWDEKQFLWIEPNG